MIRFKYWTMQENYDLYHHQMLFELSNYRGSDGRDVWQEWEIRGILILLRGGNLKK